MDNTIFNSVIQNYKNLKSVQAIALGGSSAAKTHDSSSDLDVYVFTKESIPVKTRENFIKKISSNYEVGGEYFGLGDEFFVNKLNKQLDVMYWDKNWFSNVVENTWVKHFPSNGYTTSFLYTLQNFNILHDKENWLKKLQEKISSPYPKALKDNIITRNMMLLKDKPFASYYEQIEKAIKRNDIVSINHRIAAFMASYFDILFAANELLHPGEKRLIKYAKDNCKKLPQNFEKDITNLLKQPNSDTLNILDSLVKNIKKII